jgi:hypothetical protein
MAGFQIPDLDALAKMPDQEIRFYAIVGVLMSVTGALERLEFSTFQKGTQLPEDAAASIFYEVLNDSARSSMARAAMDYRVSGDTVLEPKWIMLKRRLDSKDVKADRNLVSHNPTIRKMRPRFMGLLLALTTHTPRHIVRQDPVRVRMGRADAQTDFDRLKAACEHLFTLHTELDDFLTALPP